MIIEGVGHYKTGGRNPRTSKAY